MNFMKKLMKKIIVFCLLSLLVVWLFSIAMCEIHTKFHKDEFENIVSDDVQLGDTLKVIDYSDDYAKVYYTGSRSDLLTFSKQGNEWMVRTHKVVKYGEDKLSRVFVWPYFWDYII